LQLVTSVPTDMLPKRLPQLRRAADKQEIELNERQPEPEEETVEDLTPRGQILWIRGLTRLQHQVERGERVGRLAVSSRGRRETSGTSATVSGSGLVLRIAA